MPYQKITYKILSIGTRYFIIFLHMRQLNLVPDMAMATQTSHPKVHSIKFFFHKTKTISKPIKATSATLWTNESQNLKFLPTIMQLPYDNAKAGKKQ